MLPMPVTGAVLFLMQSVHPTPTIGSAQAERADTDFGYVIAHPDDVQAAIAEGSAARAAAKEVLSLPDARFAIVEASYADERLGAHAGGQYPIYRWVFQNGPDRRSLRPPAYVLRHEIGHGLFTRYLVPSTRSGQYGGDAPDWLDEMAAIAFEAEPQTSSRHRLAAIYAGSSRLIPLQRLLAMAHPELAGRMPLPSHDETVRMMQPASDETLPFYVTVRAFYDFLVDRTGSRAIVAELAAAFRRGEQLEHWVISRTGYGDLDALNADFMTWVASDERFAFP